MDGIHDLGGMHGFGRVEVEPDEPLFHARWESRVVGMFVPLLVGGWFNLDAFRHGIETMDPLHYLEASYFERWRTSIESQLVRAGALSREELEARLRSLREGAQAQRSPSGAMASPGPPQQGFQRELSEAPRFRRAEAVRARNDHPPGHTRLPRYARGRRGRVERVYPAFVLPDTNAHGRGENPEYLYNVRFDGRELWGGSAESATSVSLDLFESYLEPVAEGSP